MISRELLEAAARKNIIQQDQVAPLLDYIHQQQVTNGPALEPDNQNEPLRFVRSFGDVFIALGVVLLILAIGMLPISGYVYFIPVAGFIILAEWLVRVRRLSLPGIAILVAILYFVNKAIEFDYDDATVVGLGILSFTCFLFYLRYKMPFSLLPLAAGLVAISIVQIGADLIEYPIIFSGLGVIVFFAAMSFDIRDTERQTYLSDSAFWLHLLAAPLIVHGLMISMLVGQHEWIADMGQAAFIVLFFFVILSVALILDRRAMLVSTQFYMIYAVTQLLQDRLDSTQNIIMYVLLILGFVIIFFGTYWYRTRRFIFGFLDKSAISRFIPAFVQLDHPR